MIDVERIAEELHPGDRVRLVFRVYFRGKVDTTEYYTKLLLRRALEDIDRRVREELEARGFSLDNSATRIPAPITDYIDLYYEFTKVSDPVPLKVVVTALLSIIITTIIVYLIIDRVALIEYYVTYRKWLESGAPSPAPSPPSYTSPILSGFSQASPFLSGLLGLGILALVVYLLSVRK